MIVDDNTKKLTIFKNNYKNITFLQINNIFCINYGYTNMNFTINKLVSGWEKAILYFSIEHKYFDHIWFIEDDVFFYDEQTIENIDKQYLYDDLLSNSYDTNIDGNSNEWHWNKININYFPPYYNGMMCIIRLSQKMLDCIHNYANKNKTLFFLEALFPTIAIKNNLIYNTPPEFNEIHYRKNFEIKNISKNILYHPIKNLYEHSFYRKNL